MALGVNDETGNRIALWDLSKAREIDGPIMKHLGLIEFLTCLPDGNTVVSRDKRSNGFHFWNLTTRRQIKTVLPIVPGKKHYRADDSALSRDGKRSAWFIKTYEGDSEDKGPGKVDGKLIQVIEDGKKALFQFSERFDGNVLVALSPDGKQLVWAPDGGLPKIVDLETKKTISPFPSQKELWDPNEWESVDSFAFSPDGKALVCALNQRNGEILLKLWHQEKQRSVTLSSLSLSPSNVDWNRIIAFSNDGQTLAVSDARRVRLYDVAAGKERVLVQGHRAPIRHLHMSADGRSLISNDGEIACRWPRDAVARPGFRLSPEIRRLADVLKVLEEGQYRGESGADSSFHPRVHEEMYSLDLTRVLNQKGDVLDFSRSPPRKICRLNEERDDPYGSVTFSLDNQRVVLFHYGHQKKRSHAYEVFDSSTGKQIGRWPLEEGGESTFSPDGRYFAWGNMERGKIFFGDLRSGKLVKHFVKVQPRKRYPLIHATGFNHVAVSPDNLQMAAVANSTLSTKDEEPTAVYVWNVVSGKETTRIVLKMTKKTMSQLTCLAFLRDGRTLAAGYIKDNDVHLIEAASGQQRAVLHGHQGGVRSLVLSPDGRYLLSGSDDTTILVWDLDQLHPALSPSGKASPSEKGLKQLWDDLAGADAPVAFQAMQTLRRCPEQAVMLLKERVQPIPAVPAERIQRLLRELDSEEFEVRSRATRELEQLGELAAPAVKKALEKPPSLESRLRLQRLQEHVNTLSLSVDRLRLVRAMEVLEAIGNAAAREHLEKLARGASEARVTREAQESLRRLAPSH
ncbi:MAG TPA: WD40 repeat domain-containing protein [Gemmataceae bacterium]